MRIDRNRSRLSFRKRRRASCLPVTLGFSLLMGVFVLSWYWLEERLIQRQMPQPSANMQSAARAFGTGNLDAAIDQAQTLWHINPTAANAPALTLLARALVYRSYADYNRASDRLSALTLTTEAYERMPTNADIIAAHAFVLQANGRTADASRIATRALNQNANHTLARVTLSLTYGSNGIHQQAMREALAVLSDMTDLDAYRALALSLSDLGQPREAMQAIDQAIAQNDKLLALLFEKAVYAIQAGSFDTATATYFRILAFDPENVKARLRMCEMSIILRESDTALDYCAQVTERAPTWADGWYHLGREHYLRGDFSQAQNALNRCAMLQSLQEVPIRERTLDCWRLQGEIAELLGDCDVLTRTYAEYQSMVMLGGLRQTWTYPPEGPAICAAPMNSDAG